MRVAEWEVYIKQVLSHVKFKYDHNGIYFELLHHMEDRYEDFVKEGMEDERAKEAVLLCMGDADQVGEEMNKAHAPILGWIWRILMWIVVLLVIANLIPVLNTALGMVYSINAYNTKKDSPLVYTIEVNEKRKVYDTTYIIDSVRYYADGEMELRYATWQNPLSDSKKWTRGVTAMVYDGDGESYYHGSGGKRAGFYSKGQQFKKGVPLDAEKMVIYCSVWEELMTIDLTEGRMMADES